MTNKNNEYPKEIIIIEKITENSENFKEVIINVSNEFEESAVKTAIRFMEAFNERDAAKYSELLNYPHARLGKGNIKVIITENPSHIQSGFFQAFINNYKWNHSCWDYRKVIQKQFGESSFSYPVFSLYVEWYKTWDIPFILGNNKPKWALGNKNEI
jgi:hypothetical protein